MKRGHNKEVIPLNKILIPTEGQIRVSQEMQEWDLMGAQLTIDDPSGTKNTISLSFILRRKSNWYVLNHMFIMACITSLSFSTF